MPLRSLYKRNGNGQASTSYAVTIPKDDLEMDGYLDLLEQLEDHDEVLQVHIERVGAGEWRLETREDLLEDDTRAALDLPAEQIGLDEIEADAGAD